MMARHFSWRGTTDGTALLMALSGWFVALLAAGSPRNVAVTRELPERVRLGETARSTLYLSNLGRRRVRGIVRDAWEPSAGASPTRARISIPAGERRAISTDLAPFRR